MNNQMHVLQRLHFSLNSSLENVERCHDMMRSIKASICRRKDIAIIEQTAFSIFIHISKQR